MHVSFLFLLTMYIAQVVSLKCDERSVFGLTDSPQFIAVGKSVRKIGQRCSNSLAKLKMTGCEIAENVYMKAAVND